MYLASLLTGSRTYTILVLIAPIVFAFILDRDSFTLSWNEGRGGLLFVPFIIVFEIYTSTSKLDASAKRFYIVCILSLFTIFYFASLELFGFQEVIKSSAGAFNVVIPDSWTLMWDFIVLGSFLASALFILFGIRFLKVAPASIIYLAVSAIILWLDAFFPYDSLGPLQIIVPLYLEIDEAVVNWVDKYIVDLGPGTPAAAEGNILVLTGLNGPFALRVYWPSAGVNSLIIYSSVMLVFLLKMQIPMNRRVAYFVIGTLGTVAVNIVRIISLSFFPLLVTTNIQVWEGYHSVAGDIMFLPWVFVYLITIRYVIEHKTKLYVTNGSKNPN